MFPLVIDKKYMLNIFHLALNYMVLVLRSNEMCGTIGAI